LVPGGPGPSLACRSRRRRPSAAGWRDGLRSEARKARPRGEPTRPVGLACQLPQSRAAGRTTHHYFFKGEIAMRLESTIVERVETFVHHPVFAGSDRAVDLVLDDLESLERS